MSPHTSIAGASGSDPLETLRAHFAPDLELIRLLGQGTVARVYLAREPALRRMVAVKLLREDLAHDEVTRLRFEREAQAAASIRHPNVITIYRIGRLPTGMPYIAMEYVDGRTLADLVEAKGPLSLSEGRRVLASVAMALEAAHRKSIVIRDVRPENVMCETETNRIVLMDFGLVALLDTGSQNVARLTTATARLGDPMHMSPEQLRGEAVTAQSDIYGLGVMAFELLAGAGPFAGDSAVALLTAQLQGEPRKLKDMRPDVDAELSALVGRCLSKVPDRRPRAHEVYETLVHVPAPAHAPIVVETPPPSPPEQSGLVLDFLHELKRRKVVRVAGAYIAGAFFLLNVANLLLDGLAVEDSQRWFSTIAFITLCGFPVAMTLSWIFDITATGPKPERPPLRASWSRLVLPISGLAVSIAVALVIWLLLRS